MNLEAILSLISDLYTQILQLQSEIKKLKDKEKE